MTGFHTEKKEGDQKILEAAQEFYEEILEIRRNFETSFYSLELGDRGQLEVFLRKSDTAERGEILINGGDISDITVSKKFNLHPGND